MEIIIVKYRKPNGERAKYEGNVYFRQPGVVILPTSSGRSQTLIPWGMVDSIEQTFGNMSGLAPGEVENKRLSTRLAAIP